MRTRRKEKIRNRKKMRKKRRVKKSKRRKNRGGRKKIRRTPKCLDKEENSDDNV